METVSKPTFTRVVGMYLMLTKPGIIMGNAMTAAGGFALASRGHFDFWLFLAMLEGLSFIIASACVFNNYIDRGADRKMARTKNRALARGLISPRSALIFATFLGLVGVALLAFLTNLLATLAAAIGFFVYVFLYSFSKYRTVHATLIGSIAGATPPVVGYFAVANRLDLGALILFVMIAMWQMPHFFAIAIYRMKDYAAASIPVFPIQKGIQKTKLHMLIYVIAFVAASMMLPLFDYVGHAYLILTICFGSAWIGLCIQRVQSNKYERWARQMFIFSLMMVTALCVVIPFSSM